jgi:hypothetical protein
MSATLLQGQQDMVATDLAKKRLADGGRGEGLGADLKDPLQALYLSQGIEVVAQGLACGRFANRSQWPRSPPTSDANIGRGGDFAC